MAKRQGGWTASRRSPAGRPGTGGASGSRRSESGGSSAAGERHDDENRRARPLRGEGESFRNRDSQRRDKPGGREERRFDEGRRDGRGQGFGSRQSSGSTEGRSGENRPWKSRSEAGHRDDRRGRGARGPQRRERFGEGKGERGPRQDGRAGGSTERSTVRKIADNRQRTDRPADPVIPVDVTGAELDADARVELRSLPKDLATIVSRHLVMAGRLVDEDPEQAYLHAKTARRIASRVGLVREGCGVAAYHTARWAEALAELRAARRLSGREAYLPILADCERGLGRPERALSLARSAEAERLDQVDRVELRIVESGARRDMGQDEAAVVTLQIPELKDRRLRPWSTRLFYAYADALNAAGRDDEAREWFARAAAADRDGDTDAAERYAELEGLEIVDTEEDGEDVAYDADEPADGIGGPEDATSAPPPQDSDKPPNED